MITKGIIKSIDLLGNTCTVHLPFFETAGNDPIIETATVSNTPGSYNGYKVGDVVYVAFEDGNMGTPVVIGKLYLGTEKEKADPRGVSNVEESTATKKATLPADAKLAAEIDSNVPNTTVPYSSLSSIANGLNTLNTNVGQMDRDYGNRFKQVISNADGLKSELEQTASSMVAKVYGCKLDAEGNPIPQEQFGWSLQEGSWTVFDQNKTILKADENGLHVSGQIDADKGHIGKFIIGADHECPDSEGHTTQASGIYSEGYIDKYEATPTAQGVYVGTDGIKLGKNFSVDTKGKLSTKSGKIGGFTITDTKLFAGENSTFVSLGSDNTKPNYIAFTGEQVIHFATSSINYSKDTIEITVQLADSTTDQVIFGYWEPGHSTAALCVLIDKPNIMWRFSTELDTDDYIDTGISRGDQEQHTYRLQQGTLYVDDTEVGKMEKATSNLNNLPLWIGGADYGKEYSYFLHGNVYSFKITQSGKEKQEWIPDLQNGKYGLRLNNSTAFMTPLQGILSGDKAAIYLGDKDPKTAPFSVTDIGEIKATKGEVGGWNLTSTKFIKSYNGHNLSNEAVELSPTGISFKNTGGSFADKSEANKINHYLGIDTQNGLGLYGDKITRVFRTTGNTSWRNIFTANVPGIIHNSPPSSADANITLLIYDTVAIDPTNRMQTWTPAVLEDNLVSIVGVFVSGGSGTNGIDVTAWVPEYDKKAIKIATSKAPDTGTVYVSLLALCEVSPSASSTTSSQET